MQFKLVTKSDLELQKEFLLLALWTPDNEPAHKPDILEVPHIKEYYSDWGKDGDIGFFALSPDNKPIGLIQLRYKSSQTQKYADYPEIAMAVHPDYRGLGVASSLMQHLIDNSNSGLRLGVHPLNISAIKLYQKFGFCVYEVAKSGYPQMMREKQV